MKKCIFALAAWLVVMSMTAQEKIKVACVGNSITYGHGIKNRDHDAYPAVLGRLLGNEYEVKNFGISARTLMNSGDNPYMKEQIYRDALAYEPDIVTIKLGTNDSKPFNWKNNADFKNDFAELVNSFRQLPSHPKIFICLPIPGDNVGWGINDSTIVAGIIPAIKKMSRKMKLPVIDLHTAFKPYLNLLPDGVHPNVDGSAIIAYEISKAIIESKGKR